MWVRSSRVLLLLLPSIDLLICCAFVESLIRQKLRYMDGYGIVLERRPAQLRQRRSRSSHGMAWRRRQPAVFFSLATRAALVGHLSPISSCAPTGLGEIDERYSLINWPSEDYWEYIFICCCFFFSLEKNKVSFWPNTFPSHPWRC